MSLRLALGRQPWSADLQALSTLLSALLAGPQEPRKGLATPALLCASEKVALPL